MANETPRLGMRIAVTREGAGRLGELLAAAGHEVLHCPLLRVEPAESDELRRLMSEVKYDWLVLTSSRAVEAVARAGGMKPRRGVACVGDATAARAKDCGLDVSLVPARQHTKGLIEAFAALPGHSGRVLWPRGDLAPTTLKEGLAALGFAVDDPVAYFNRPDESGVAAFAQAVQAGELQVAAFASPSAVRYAAGAVGHALCGLRLFSIGPSTSAAIREAGCAVAGEALEHNDAGLAAVIVEVLHG